MTPELLWGYIMLAMIGGTVLGGLWEIYCGARWLVRKTRVRLSVIQLERQYKRPARIPGRDGG